MWLKGISDEYQQDDNFLPRQITDYFIIKRSHNSVVNWHRAVHIECEWTRHCDQVDIELASIVQHNIINSHACYKR